MKKYTLRLFRYNNYKAFEDKLAQMAEKGWFLEAIGDFFWKFRKGEPKKLTYEVTFFPEVSGFNPYTTENQEIYYEYCKAGGWSLVGADGKLQVFSTTEKNPVPIENDEELKLKNIHKCMKSSAFVALIPLVILQILIFIVFDYKLWRSIPTNPEIIFTPGFFFRCLFGSFFSIVDIYCIIDYYLWYFSYKRALFAGIINEKKDYKIKREAEKVFAYILIIILVVVFIGSCFMGYWRKMLIEIGSLAIMNIPYLITIALLKKAKVNREYILPAAFTVFVITVLLLYRGT